MLHVADGQHLCAEPRCSLDSAALGHLRETLPRHRLTCLSPSQGWKPGLSPHGFLCLQVLLVASQLPHWLLSPAISAPSAAVHTLVPPLREAAPPRPCTQPGPLQSTCSPVQWAAFLGHRPPGAGLAGLPSPCPSLSPSSCFPVHPGEFKVGFDPETFNMWFRLPGSPFLSWSVGPALTPSPRQTGIGVGSSGGSARTERMPRRSFEGHAAGPGPLCAVSRPRPQL